MGLSGLSCMLQATTRAMPVVLVLTQALPQCCTALHQLLYCLLLSWLLDVQVANKVVEMLMMRSGIDVCCTSDDDVQRMERVSSTDSSS